MGSDIEKYLPSKYLYCDNKSAVNGRAPIKKVYTAKLFATCKIRSDLTTEMLI
jgi:hypothetical protein